MTIGIDSSIAGYLVDNPQMAKSSVGSQATSADASNERARETAEKFEALLLQTMLKAMRKTTPGNTLFGSDQADMYLDMFDKQIAAGVSESSSLGIADAIYRQLVPQANTSPSVISGGLGERVNLAVSSEPSVRTGDVSSSDEPNGVSGALQFMQRIATQARETAAALGTSLEAVVAIAALETGWGSRVAIRADGGSTNNLFGIKADSSWTGDSQLALTGEFEQGEMRMQRASFRSYGSEQQSVQDFGEFIRQNPRYQQALERAENSEQFIREIHKAGYATDPDYADKAIALMHEIRAMPLATGRP